MRQETSIISEETALHLRDLSALEAQQAKAFQEGFLESFPHSKLQDPQYQALVEQIVASQDPVAAIGGMNVGKTDLMCEVVRRLKGQGAHVLALRPALDTRRHETAIVPYRAMPKDGSYVFPEFIVPALAASRATMDAYEKTHGIPDVLFLDEPQFSEQEMAYALLDWADSDVRVLVSGLYYNFRHEPFPMLRNEEIAKMQSGEKSLEDLAQGELTVADLIDIVGARKLLLASHCRVEGCNNPAYKINKFYDGGKTLAPKDTPLIELANQGNGGQVDYLNGCEEHILKY